MSGASAALTMVSHRTAPAAEHVGHEALARERLESMFQAHHTFIWRFLRRQGLSPEASADLTQQTFLIAAERVSDIRIGSERAFLFGTALRLARATARASRRVTFETDMDLRVSAAPPAEQQAVQQQTLELADRVLAELSPNLLTVFVLFELEGVPMREIATMLGVPRGTVASRLRRAREAFRAGVARYERPPSDEVPS
jgi:RNA polymerase sigma-70 factor (ECF subfamily)